MREKVIIKSAASNFEVKVSAFLDKDSTYIVKVSTFHPKDSTFCTQVSTFEPLFSNKFSSFYF